MAAINLHDLSDWDAIVWTHTINNIVEQIANLNNDDFEHFAGLWELSQNATNVPETGRGLAIDSAKNEGGAWALLALRWPKAYD